MRLLTCLSLSLISVSSFAGNLFCEAWYQKPGEELLKSPMPMVSQTANDTIFKSEFNGFTFTVDWNKQLTSFYTWIDQSANRILSTTGRVPTDNHPECFTDLNLPGGPRLSVNCEVH